MSFTTEAIDAPVTPKSNLEQSQFDLPSKEFVGYDPKGTTTVTGTPIQKKDLENSKQSNINEQVEDAPVQKEEESVKLSPQVTALVRKEQAQRKREHVLAQRERELAQKLADADKYAQIKAKLEAKDYSAADELGLSYDEYTQYLIDKKSSEDPTEKRYRQVEEKLSSLEKAQEEQAIKEYQANQALWKQEIAKIVGENEEFSTIKELGVEHLVLQHVNDSFEEDGIELTSEQAAKEIEAELVRRAEKFASVTKIKKKFSDPSKVLGAPKTAPKTITQSMTVTSGQKPSSKPFHMMSEMEQWEEAARRVQASRIQR